MSEVSMSTLTGIDQVIAQIRAVQNRSRETETEAVKHAIELGYLFGRLKAQATGTWRRKLQQLRFHPRVVSRLMRAASTFATPEGTVPDALLERLPADPLKLEALCALALPEIERLIQERDCRMLDRSEVVALVRERQGKPSISNAEKKPPTKADLVRNSWATSVEAMLKKFDNVKDENERASLIQFLEESLDDLRQSLRGDDTEISQPEALEKEKAEEPDLEQVSDEGDDKDAENAVEVEPPQVQKTPRVASKQEPSAGRNRAKPQHA